MSKEIRTFFIAIWKRVFRKAILFLPAFLILCMSQDAFTQAGPCPKPKVAVLMTEIKDDKYQPLQRQKRWVKQLQSKVMEELKKNSPGTEFVSPTEQHDYIFRYGIVLGDLIEAEDISLLDYEFSWMDSWLSSVDPCGIESRQLDRYISKDKNILRTIESNIAKYGDIGVRIEEHEKSHRVPPRGPKMEITQDPDKVSPLEEEQEQKITIKVTNCRGEPVYDKYHGQKVFLPKKTERGEIKPDHNFPQEFYVTDNVVTLIIRNTEGTARAIYTLVKGMKAGMDRATILTCGLDRKITEVTEIKISGLKIKVSPEKTEIPSGEQTRVWIYFYKIDNKGAETPVAGKKIQLKIEGLVDGKVTPTGDPVTDQNGRALLTYHAGKKDKRVKFLAKYQPKKFKEWVQDEATVEVWPEHDLSLKLEMRITQKGDCKHELPAVKGRGWEKYEASTTKELLAILHVAFNLKSSRLRKKENEIREEYVSQSRIFSVTYNHKAHSVSDHASEAGSHTITDDWVEEMVNPRLRYPTHELTLYIDKKDNKVKIASWEHFDCLYKLKRTHTQELIKDGVKQPPKKWSEEGLEEFFQFIPAGTFSNKHIKPLNIKDYDIPLSLQPVGSGLPYEIGDGINYFGGKIKITRSPESKYKHFASPLVCKDHFEENIELKWEVTRRPK